MPRADSQLLVDDLSPRLIKNRITPITYETKMETSKTKQSEKLDLSHLSIMQENIDLPAKAKEPEVKMNIPSIVVGSPLVGHTPNAKFAQISKPI